MNDLVIKIKEPTHCHLWQKENLTIKDLATFENVRIFEESSHMTRSLLKCRQCEQLYFYEEYEIVDFSEDGEDSIYSTYIPVESENIAEEMAKKMPIELLLYIPKIQWNNSNAPQWVGKEV